YNGPTRDRAFGFDIDHDYQDYVEKNDPTRVRWDGLKTGQPAMVYFWYRESPRYLVPQQMATTGRASMSDPPTEVSGMVGVRLDPRGRLIELEAVPPQLDETKGPSPSPDWSGVFAAAGLEMGKFTPAESRWIPPVYADSRSAWEGVLPDQPLVK